MELDGAGLDSPVRAGDVLRDLQTLRAIPPLHLQLRGCDPLHVVQGVLPGGVADGAEVRCRWTLAPCRFVDRRCRHQHPLAGIIDAPGSLRTTLLPSRVRQGEPRRLSPRLFWLRFRLARDRQSLGSVRLFDAETDLGLVLWNSVSDWSLEGSRWQRGGGRAEPRGLRHKNPQRYLGRSEMVERSHLARKWASDRISLLWRRGHRRGAGRCVRGVAGEVARQ